MLYEAPSSTASRMNYYVIVRGPLGVGKSTVAAALAKSIRGVVVSIDTIVESSWDGGSVRLYVSANKTAVAKARRAFGSGRPVVFDGCFYWKTQIRNLERLLPVPHAVFTLRAPLSVCILRDSQRELAHGAEAAEQVYRKVTRFTYGTLINANRRLSDIVREMRSEMPDNLHPVRRDHRGRTVRREVPS